MTKTYDTLISVDQFHSISQKEGVIVFDCRFYLNDPSLGRKEYLQGHVPGAIYLDTNHDLSSPVIKGVTGRHPLPHPDILTSTLRSAGMNKGDHVIAYDQSNGVYASRLWWLLRWLGHNNTSVVDGGFRAWNTAKLPIDNQWPINKPGNFESHLRSDMTVELDDIKKINGTLVDSREYRRYTGEYEPIDPVAGHIPGAICIPYMENTNEDGKWKSAEELKKRFSDINSTNDESPVFYCGSGVTACHNILAYKIATGQESRLYPGSWSEWINYHVGQ